MEVCGRELRIDGMLLRIGFIDGEGYQFLDDPAAAVESIRKSRLDVDLFTFLPRLSDAQPRYNYPFEWDNMAVLPVTSFEHWMAHQLSSRIRSTIRKTAKEGLEVREVPFDESLIQGISAIYNEAPVRQGRRFPHYGIDLEKLRAMKATFIERATFIGAFFAGELIGFAKLVQDEQASQAGFMHILSMIRHRDKAPTNAIIAQAVRSCADRGIPNLWYVKFHYGRKGHDSLAEFKRRNGFQKQELPRYYVPLTLKGRVALRLGLHHSLVERAPESLASAYRRLRSSWYERKFGVESA